VFFLRVDTFGFSWSSMQALSCKGFGFFVQWGDAKKTSEKLKFQY